jgi:DNA-binding MarR family transcriptional regulator
MPEEQPRQEQPWYETILIPALLRHARNAYGRAMRAALAEVGCDDMPKNGMWVIGGLALGAAKGGTNGNDRMPLGALVRDLGVSKQAAGQLVDTLVLRGYLERAVDPQDRRRLTLTLTDRGQAAATAQRAARERIDARLEAEVGGKTIAAMRKALGALCAMSRDAGGEHEH